MRKPWNRNSIRREIRLWTSSSARAETSAFRISCFGSRRMLSFYFTDVNWPDFTPERFVDAMVDFAGRDRHFWRTHQ